MTGKRKIVSEFVALTTLLFIALSCDIQSQWFLDVPASAYKLERIYYRELTKEEKYHIEGIYKVNSGNELLGDTLVIKQTRDKISVWGLKDGFHSVLDGKKDSLDIVLEGYWRCALNDQTGLIRFETTLADSQENGNLVEPEIHFTGTYGFNQSDQYLDIKIEKVAVFTQKLRADPFLITAHRGGGRTADHLPYSENSIEMLNYTEYLGSTAIETDITLTKDKVPVLYHDDDLNLRLIRKGPLYGYIKDYTVSQLKEFVRLIHGEQIPTLEEALKFVINNTLIRLVLLDIKDPESMKYTVAIQKKYIELAMEKGRDLDILVCIRINDVYENFIGMKNYRDIPSCCNMESEKAIALNSKIWNYRWTQGIRSDEIEKVYQSGCKCLVWTLDMPEFIDIYISHGNNDPAKRFDGILTNYPTILAYYHYVRHNQ